MLLSELKEKLYSNLPTITLEELFGYIDEIGNGYIRANYHPEDSNIIILNYTELAVYERRWNKYTISARGLILDLTDIKNNGKIYVLAKPFEKFFNYGEIPEYEQDIDFTKIETVMEKVDGSLGISYFFNDEIRFATKLSFESEQAIKATEIWREKYAKYIDLNEYVSAPITYLVEIIYPENRIVVDYEGKEDLIALGAIRLTKNKIIDLPYEYVKCEARSLNMPVTKQYQYTLEDLMKLKEKIPANKQEGWVVRFSNGKRLKIKGDEYIEVHKLIFNVSDKAKFRAWADGELNSYIMSLPEEFRKEIEELGEKLDFLANDIKSGLDSLGRLIKSGTKTRKEFALRVNEIVYQKYKPFIFKYYDLGYVPIKMVREYMAKNYLDYLEEINNINIIKKGESDE